MKPVRHLTKSGLRELKTGFRGAVFFAAALNFADYAMSDQQTWVGLVGHIGSDVVKGVVATEVGVFAGELIMGGVATLASAPVLAGVFAIGAASAVIALIAGAFIDYEDDYKLHVTDQLIDKMKEEFHKL